ncbi:MAG: hypothetical protein U0842_20950 [Candidatus Binatia bacterium]
MLAAVVVWSGVAEAFGSPMETRGAMPAVPPPYVRFPDGFDRDGCALIPRTGAPPSRVCPARRASLSSAVAGDWGRYLGYEGPAAAPSLSPGRVVLLPETLTTAPRGWWRAAGLVRNDTSGIVREVRVTVTLATSAERPLGSATVVVPVREVRPGEPAPFEIRTLVPVQSVRHVTWSVAATSSGGTTSSSRMAEIELGRIATSPSSAGESLEASLVAGGSAPDGDATRIGWGILRNWGPLPIARAKVVGMWIDERGRAVRLVEGRVAPSVAGDASFAADLLPGGTRSFELFEHEPSPSRGAGWRLALWQSSS